MKASPHKRIAIAVTVCVLIASGSVAAIFVTHKNSSSQDETNYRQYTVAQGDVTVGVTESGTVALEDDAVSFPVACKIDSVLVKSGQKVKKGDALVKLNLDSVSDGSADTKQKLESEKLTLQSALNDQKAKLETAKITYESSKYLASTASATKDLTLSELQNNITSAQTSLNSDKKNLAAYQTLQKNWPADYQKLQNLKKWMDDAKASETSYSDQLSNFKDSNSTVISMNSSLQNTMETAKAKYLAADKGDTDVDGGDADYWEDQYEAAKDAYNAYYSFKASSILTQQKTLEDKVAQYTAEYNNYSEAYNNFKATYDDKYKVTGSELDDKVTSLENTLKTDQYNLEKAKKTAQISSAEANTKEKTDLNTASNAQNTYDLTVAQLSQAVTDAQESCDKLQREMDEITNAMNGNGVLTSPADGVVASVSCEAGGSAAAEQTLLTVSTDNSISLSLSVSEDDITNVSIGQEASISLSAYDGQSFDAQVESITAEPARSGSASVTYTVVVQSTGKTGDIGTVYDGMSGEATIIQKRAKNVLYVSNRAITFQNGKSTVLVRGQDEAVSPKEVKTGFSDGTYVEITSGLQKGDTVLAESTVVSK